MSEDIEDLSLSDNNDLQKESDTLSEGTQDESFNFLSEKRIFSLITVDNIA